MNATTYRSLPDLFLKRVEATPDRMAYQYPVGDGWASLTWKQTEDRVRALACGLLSLGLKKGERCAILSSTRLEWILADLATLCAAGATTTIYPSNTGDECAYILGDSNTAVVFAEDDTQVEKLAAERDKLPQVRKVVTFEGKGGHNGWAITLHELEQLGRTYDREHPKRFTEVVDAVTLQDLATLIYTSGTTGKPKGVELIHDCWVYEAEAIEKLQILGPEDHQYLWLPLAHSFGKVLQVMQYKIGFPTTVDGRIPKLIENLAYVRPTFMAAAPRIFEKVYNKVVTGVQEAGGLKVPIFGWSLGVGKQVSQLRQRGSKPGPALAAKYAIADRLVFSKLRQRFGGRIRFFISGSAPLSLEMAEFFHAAGILILEGYGLTETSAASFVNVPSKYKFGTVGPALPDTEVKIAKEDGEVLLRGRGVMRGYHNLPEATREIFTEDGWLHTGDIGELDDDKYLRITDRKKDLIKTSGGKYIAPQAIEGKLKALCPYVSQVVVHGDRRPFCTALITMDEESLPRWAQEHKLPAADIEVLTQHDAVREMVKAAIDELNTKLASYETIKRFAILRRDLTIESGDLTPNSKVKRKLVEEKHKAIIEGFYEGTISRV